MAIAMINFFIAIYALIGIAFGTLAYHVEADGIIPLKVALTALLWPIYLAIAVGATLAEVGKELQARNNSDDLGTTWKQFKKNRG